MNIHMVDTAINIAINQASQKQAMSSREIATLCNKQHQHVKRDVETMCQQLELDVSKFGHIYLDGQNRQQTEYLLDKETCLCLVAGYNAKLRMAIIKRWQELEQTKQVVALLPQTKLEALKAYVAEIEAHEQTKQHLTHQKECAKLENGKSIYGASLKQVNNKLNTNYHWKPLQQWCDDNDVFPETIYPNGYDSICVRVYPTQAWDDVYQVDLNQLFV